MDCLGCGRALDEEARFCPGCGLAVEASCKACGASLDADARFCKHCGTAVEPAARATDRSTIDRRRDHARERKVATLLFADLVAFTGLGEAHDPELVSSLVGDTFERLSIEVQRDGSPCSVGRRTAATEIDTTLWKRWRSRCQAGPTSSS